MPRNRTDARGAKRNASDGEQRQPVRMMWSGTVGAKFVASYRKVDGDPDLPPVVILLERQPA